MAGTDQGSAENKLGRQDPGPSEYLGTVEQRALHPLAAPRSTSRPGLSSLSHTILSLGLPPFVSSHTGSSVRAAKLPLGWARLG